MENKSRRGEIIEPEQSLTEKFVFLKLFIPRNFNRVTPVAYIFLVSLLLFIFGMMFVHFLAIFSVLGGFMIFLFALYAIFWKWPIMNKVLGV